MQSVIFPIRYFINISNELLPHNQTPGFLFGISSSLDNDMFDIWEDANGKDPARKDRQLAKDKVNSMNLIFLDLGEVARPVDRLQGEAKSVG
jgi:hypothetical protein